MKNGLHFEIKQDYVQIFYLSIVKEGSPVNKLMN